MFQINPRMCYPVSEDALELALETSENFLIPSKTRQLAEKIIQVYIFNEFLKQGIEIIEEEQVHARFVEIAKGYINTKLANEGLIDVYFEDEDNTFKFKLNKKGKQVLGPVANIFEKKFKEEEEN